MYNKPSTYHRHSINLFNKATWSNSRKSTIYWRFIIIDIHFTYLINLHFRFIDDDKPVFNKPSSRKLNVNCFIEGLLLVYWTNSCLLNWAFPPQTFKFLFKPNQIKTARKVTNSCLVTRAISTTILSANQPNSLWLCILVVSRARNSFIMFKSSKLNPFIPFWSLLIIRFTASIASTLVSMT